MVTATSFSGSGAALTGIDATAIKDSGGNVKVQAQASGAVYTGIHTFNSDIDIDGHTNLDNVNVAGVATFASAVNTGALTASTGTFSGNVSIGGTLTYEDVTNIDSVGVVTAREGVFLPDTKELKVGNTAASPDLKIYHNSNSYIDNTTNTNLNIRSLGSGAIQIKPYTSGVNLSYANNIKLSTETGGVNITGVCTATSFVGDLSLIHI